MDLAEEDDYALHELLAQALPLIGEPAQGDAIGVVRRLLQALLDAGMVRVFWSDESAKSETLGNRADLLLALGDQFWDVDSTNSRHPRVVATDEGRAAWDRGEFRVTK